MLRHKSTTIISELQKYFSSSEKTTQTLLEEAKSLKISNTLFDKTIILVRFFWRCYSQYSTLFFQISSAYFLLRYGVMGRYAIVRDSSLRSE